MATTWTENIGQKNTQFLRNDTEKTCGMSLQFFPVIRHNIFGVFSNDMGQVSDIDTYPASFRHQSTTSGSARPSNSFTSKPLYLQKYEAHANISVPNKVTLREYAFVRPMSPLDMRKGNKCSDRSEKIWCCHRGARVQGQ
jgi:hypothetical protein